MADKHADSWSFRVFSSSSGGLICHFSQHSPCLRFLAANASLQRSGLSSNLST
jgi:hypothetical protein